MFWIALESLKGVLVKSDDFRGISLEFGKVQGGDLRFLKIHVLAPFDR